ncbi:MAG: outer membrane lipoprotein-sorting protein [Spirochaetaceae bacterium]
MQNRYNEKHAGVPQPPRVASPASRIAMVVAMMALTAASAWSQSAEEVIRRMERNQTHETSYIEGRMILRDRFGSRTSSFEMYSEGEENVLVEFTSAAEAGQKVLRTKDEIYLFYPDASELIRLQGAALRESMLGSDVSYEDMTGNRGILDTYRATLAGRETIRGFDCFVVDLEARSRDVAYPRQKIWVDSERFVMRRSERYALSGRLLKEIVVTALMERSGLVFPAAMTIADTLKADSGTEFIVDEAQIGIRLPPNIFSLEELTW